ncbi:MAG: ATP-binding cassette domain-containing protein [Actinomycetota bacterium]|nr:ATP-binding cassette domain-containing protein [Actinomycetota bacterium]
MTAVAVAEGVTVRRGRAVTALDDVSLTLSTGVTGVLGPNGAGKTTLFRALVGLQRIHAGRIRTRGSVGYLPQDLRLFKGFTSGEVLSYVGWVRGLPSREARDEAGRCLELVGMADRRRDKVRTLSGGLQQRLVIASAFVGDPGLVVLDEPTVGLDLEQQHFFRSLVRSEGQTRAIVVSSHVAADLVRTCSQLVVLDRGRLLFHGSLGDFDALGTAAPEDGAGLPEDDVSRFERRYLHLLEQTRRPC